MERRLYALFTADWLSQQNMSVAACDTHHCVAYYRAVHAAGASTSIGDDTRSKRIAFLKGGKKLLTLWRGGRQSSFRHAEVFCEAKKMHRFHFRPGLRF